MFLLDDVIVHSASDLTAALRCEYAVLQALDVRLGRVEASPREPDEMLAYAAELGDVQEARLLQDYQRQWPGGVREIAAADTGDRADLLRAHQDTLDALRGGTPVVAQGSFFDGRFHGRADFLVRGDDGGYALLDSKLARGVKVTALIQLAAYADQLLAAGVPLQPEVGLVLGSGETSWHRLADLLPVYRHRSTRLRGMLDAHQRGREPVVWGAPGQLTCGRCEACAEQVAARRDLLVVAGLSVPQRTVLREVGITTVDELAASEDPVAGMSTRVWQRLRDQARMQVGQHPPSGDTGVVSHRVVDDAGLRALPAPSPGDIFFDFEGDPLWDGDGQQDWGLEYLFGLVERPADPDGDPVYRSFWADDRPSERQALVDFLDYLRRRREQWPDLHVYHYAPYERTALIRLAVRHGVGEEEVDDLLRAGVLVDLYATVRTSVQVSQPSYSLKKLEPLYWGGHQRVGVTGGGESVVAYARYARARATGQGDAPRLRQDILDYNTDDCVSTLLLDGWLRDQAAADGVEPGRDEVPAGPEAADVEAKEPSPAAVLAEQLAAAAGPRDGRDADAQAIAMVAATLEYHRREDKPFWWSHFDRLAQPVQDWADGRNALVVESSRVLTDWARPTPRSSVARVLELRGTLAPGSAIEPDEGFYAVFDPPFPAGSEPDPGAVRVAHNRLRVDTVALDPATGQDVVTVTERLARGETEGYDATPMAVAPSAGPRTVSIDAALLALAEQVAEVSGTSDPVRDRLPAQPGLDVLRRLPPRMLAGRTRAVLPPGGDAVGPITGAVRDLDRSYLAVQGPPGTGKTHVGSHVIATLVREHGWRVGVVSQGHEAVANLLDAVVRAGVPAAQVAKKLRHADDPGGLWTAIGKDDHAAFLSGLEHGGVIGGTAWDLTNTKRVAPGSLDLLVVDEAGQFSLASTVASSTAAQRLLLLGDPQQLPQVSQGTHPEPVDLSCLGWLADGHAALPDTYGYLLDRSWRMHSALCAGVSALAYEGRLRSEEPVTDARHLEGVAPGVHVVTVEHHGASVESPEEARAVREQIQGLLGRAWTDPSRPGGESPRPLGQADVLVVAPYNAQVARIRGELERHGLGEVRVGTVDMFQGQQAPIVVVSMSASAASEVPRGMGFLLSRNRVNVAVSRGQWCAVVVRSPGLTDHLPSNPAELADLGAFIGLCDAATPN